MKTRFGPWKPLLFLVLLLLVFTADGSLAQSLEFGPPFIITQSFAAPSGLGLDPANGRVLIADTGNHRVKYAPLADIDAAPAWNDFGFVPGLEQPEALNGPQGVAADAAGNAYVVDTFGNEVHLFRWNAATNAYADDPAFAQDTRNTVAGVDIAFPRDIAVGPDGSVYLLDSGNRRILVADGPDDSSWQVWRQNPAWGNPHGLDVAADGRVYLADTDNHQILRMQATGAEEAIGSFGTGNGQFRFPRDVAVSADGRIFVADTFNYRIVILNGDGSHYLNLGDEFLFWSLEKIEVDADNRVFVVDSGHNRLVAYLGPVAEPPFDAYARDHKEDTGAEPSSLNLMLSRDILIRNNPDVDLQQAASSGLQRYAAQPPAPGINNHVYVAVRNRGAHAMAGARAQLFWVDPYDESEFLPQWSAEGFYRSYTSPDVNQPSNSIFVPLVEPRQTVEGQEEDGMAVFGPLIWRLPEPASPADFDGRFFLFLRIFHPNDRVGPIPTDATYIDDELGASSVFILHDLASDATARATDLETQLERLDVDVVGNVGFFSGGILDLSSLVTLIMNADPDVVYFVTGDKDAEGALGKELKIRDYQGVYFQELDKFLAISHLVDYVRRHNNVAMWRTDIIVDPKFPVDPFRPPPAPVHDTLIQ